MSIDYLSERNAILLRIANSLRGESESPEADTNSIVNDRNEILSMIADGVENYTPGGGGDCDCVEYVKDAPDTEPDPEQEVPAGGPGNIIGNNVAGAEMEGEQIPPNSATGGYSSAFGLGTEADGFGSFATGIGGVAEGQASHAEGFRSSANGPMSHAEGCETTAEGPYSHAEGLGTRTSEFGEAQHVEGAYNIYDSEGQYIHIVGNGTDENNTSNAHTLDRSGNGWYAGTLEAEGGLKGNVLLGGIKLLVWDDGSYQQYDVEIDENGHLIATITPN